MMTVLEQTKHKGEELKHKAQVMGAARHDGRHAPGAFRERLVETGRDLLAKAAEMGHLAQARAAEFGHHPHEDLGFTARARAKADEWRELAEEKSLHTQHAVEDMQMAARHKMELARLRTRHRAQVYRHQLNVRYEHANPWAGFAAGTIGGLAGTIVMTQFQSAMMKAAEKRKSDEGPGEVNEQQDEPATVVAAEKVSQRLLHKEIPEDKKSIIGQGMHYGFGTVMGGAYGAVAEVVPEVTAGHGTAFGAALFLGADEAAVPAFGLSKKPTQMPAKTHVFGLVSHLVYGVTTETVRRAVRRML